ncbi:MAG: hypothetical protein WBJ41_08810 [Chromatiaceae bacterium]
MTDISCLLRHSRGKSECGVGVFLASQLAADRPQLVWVDPDPLAVDYHGATGRRFMALPLVEGDPPAWMLEVPLAEARIFWQGAALHVIAGEAGGCRWTRITESREDHDGDERVQREIISVLSLRDQARFGFKDAQGVENLQAIIYKRQGLIRAWRIAIKSWGPVDA